MYSQIVPHFDACKRLALSAGGTVRPTYLTVSGTGASTARRAHPGGLVPEGVRVVGNRSDEVRIATVGTIKTEVCALSGRVLEKGFRRNGSASRVILEKNQDLRRLMSMNLHDLNSKVTVPYGYASLLSYGFPQEDLSFGATLSEVERYAKIIRNAMCGDDLAEFNRMNAEGGSVVGEAFRRDGERVVANAQRALRDALEEVSKAAWFDAVARGEADTDHLKARGASEACIAYGTQAAVQAFNKIPSGAADETRRKMAVMAAKEGIYEWLNEFLCEYNVLTREVAAFLKRENEVRSELSGAQGDVRYANKSASEIHMAAERAAKLYESEGINAEIIKDHPGRAEYMRSVRKSEKYRNAGLTETAAASDPRKGGRKVRVHIDIRPSGNGGISLPPVIMRGFEDLVGNAVKYTHAGGDVFVTVIGRDGGTQLSVTNYGGIGISPDSLQRLGERAYRAENVRNIPGTGVGLSHLIGWANRFGGKVQITSTYAEGNDGKTSGDTRVTVTVPDERTANECARARSAEEGGRGARPRAA